MICNNVYGGGGSSPTPTEEVLLFDIPLTAYSDIPATWTYTGTSTDVTENGMSFASTQTLTIPWSDFSSRTINRLRFCFDMKMATTRTYRRIIFQDVDGIETIRSTGKFTASQIGYVESTSDTVNTMVDYSDNIFHSIEISFNYNKGKISINIDDLQGFEQYLSLISTNVSDFIFSKDNMPINGYVKNLKIYAK